MLPQEKSLSVQATGYDPKKMKDLIGLSSIKVLDGEDLSFSLKFN